MSNVLGQGRQIAHSVGPTSEVGDSWKGTARRAIKSRAAGSHMRCTNKQLITTAASTSGTLFCWLKYGGGGSIGTANLLKFEGNTSSDYCDLSVDITTNFLHWEADNAASTGEAVDMTTTYAMPQDVWTAVMISWDTTTAGTTDLAYLYTQPLNGALATGFTLNTHTLNATTSWTGDGSLGASGHEQGNSSAFTTPWDTYFSQLWISNGTAIDWTDSTTRERFVSASGEPQVFDADGTVGGVTPSLFSSRGSMMDFGGTWDRVSGTLTIGHFDEANGPAA